ncbi:MAG: hypothetical protein EA343_08275 [Nodularia sp. (in: Bacteria)]|nr:MAG: hypothetical protein EA343_08275 [Nodularia sp. (in: cyanobacteria)]
MVPVHIDALYLNKSEPSTEATADFRRLPYYDSRENRDVNSDIPWLGDSVATAPFANSNMTLQKGVHLHWALPDGLCHGEVVNGKLEMPAVPNRWLIRRRPVGSQDEKIWVVESDYLWSPMNQAPAVNIFHKTSDEGRPYRFLGRKLPWDEWIKLEDDSNPSEYLEQLTAITNGEPTFAAYYPNCMTVFGFQDWEPNLESDNWSDIHYDVFGWYGDTKLTPKLNWEVDSKSLGSYIEKLRGWRVDGNQQPETLICYASIKLVKDKDSNSLDNQSQDDESLKVVKVAIGNTASEALSALIAREIAEEKSLDFNLTKQIEEQLEELHIEDQLASEVQDIGLHLRQYRHQKSFEPVQECNYWTIHSDRPCTDILPNDVLVALRHLNHAQAKYSQLTSELEQSSRQLYGDWCSYIRCVYRRTDGGRGKFLDIDEVVNYIETRSLARVSYLSDVIKSTRDRLEIMKAELEGQITQLNHDLKQAAKLEDNPEMPSRQVQYSLQSIAGARYWQPTDPVVLITGGKVQLNERHGQDGRNATDGILPCHIHETSFENFDNTDAMFRNRRVRNSLLQWLSEQWEEQWEREKNPPSRDNSTSKSIGFRQVHKLQRPWNPLFFDWGIDMHPAESRMPGGSRNYDSDIITGNYSLGSQNPDIEPEVLWTHDNPDRFSGRCVIGDTPSLVLKERIEDVLRRRLMVRLIILGDIRKTSDPRSYLDELLQKRASLQPDDVEKRTNFRNLVELWANPDDDKESEYLQELTNWYAKLANDYKQVPLNALPTMPVEPLPTSPAELDALVKWYGERPLRAEASRTADPLYVALLAYQKLFDNADKITDETEKLRPRAFLGQSLSGFNGELIQWKLGLSLPIDEPIGLTPYREFTQRVATAVGESNEWTTEPTNNFSPIRSGILKLDKLRLIDNFGQVTDITCDDKVIVPTPYKKGRPGEVFLPPRLVQPARVMFRWLDVKDAVSLEKPALDTNLQQSQEMVEAEARSPICGWLVPEKLRGRLLVFDGDGNPLGALAADKNTQTLEWVNAPGLPGLSFGERQRGRQWLKFASDRYYTHATNGQPEPQTEADESEIFKDLGELGTSLHNVRLARVLLYLWATRSPQFLEGFLNTLDDAMANIDPEGTTSMGSLALLIGRPVAVVGAELNLQLKDKPAIRQDWDAFLMDQYRHHRDTDKFEHVKFRLRLGQYQSRNDGVVGYWMEESSGFAENTFVAQAADDNDPSRRLELREDEIPAGGLKAKINAHDKGDQADDLNFTQSVANPPLQVTLLMDPRGKAHLTTGILPVKSIDIPRPLWEPAMEAMRLWFPVAPILTRPRSRRVPMPTLVDRQWSWLEQVKTDSTRIWQTLYPRPSVKRHTLQTVIRELNELLKRKNLPEYNLILMNLQVTESFPNERKSLIIARKVDDQNKEYQVRIFDSAGKRIAIDQRLTDSELVQELDEALREPSKYQEQEQELVRKIITKLGYSLVDYALILRRPQNTESVPNQGKSSVIARKVNNENKNYLIRIFDSAGNSVAIDERLSDSELVQELDNALLNPLGCQDRELLQKITASLGHSHPELDRLIEKGWLEEMKPPGDRLYVKDKEDRQPLEDWALETLLNPRLAEISLALVSPGEETDFDPGIEVREGWLLLQSSESEKKT